MSSIFLQVACVYLVISSIFCYVGIRYVLLYDCIEIKDTKKPTLTRVIGVLSLIIMCIFIQPLIQDIIEKPIQSNTLYIKDREHTKHGLYENITSINIQTQETVQLTNWFHHTYVRENGCYHIHYKKHTEIILDVTEITCEQIEPTATTM